MRQHITGDEKRSTVSGAPCLPGNWSFLTEKHAAAATIHSDILSVIRKPLSLLLSSVLSNSCQPNKHPAVIEHEGGGKVSHFKVASIYRDQPMPCRHKGNKQVLLSAASSIPSQPLCTTTSPQLPPLKWKKCLSKGAVWKSSAFTHVRQARVLLSRIVLGKKKILPLFQSAGFKCRFITPDHRRHRHWRSENKWLSGVKTSTARRAFCQTWTQQLGLSTKGAPLCCWGYRWQVPHRCGCLKIKRSSVVCRGPSVSVIASSRQLSGKLEGPN